MAGSWSGGVGGGQGLVDLSNTRVLSAETLSELSKYNVVLDGEVSHKGKPFKVLHNFRMRSVRSGTMEFPGDTPTQGVRDLHGGRAQTYGEGRGGGADVNNAGEHESQADLLGLSVRG